jgi:Ca2+-binding EF-hand superfamily protein
MMAAFKNVFETVQDLNATISKYDVNGDGKLSFEEFCDLMIP